MVTRMGASGWRARMRRTRAGAWTWKAIVFAVGLIFILIGFVAIVLPGPLTIPPILLGVYIWSTEFAWAERWKHRMVAQARVAWQAAKRRPVQTTAVTLSGLVLLAVGVVALQKYDVVDRLLSWFG